MMKMVWEKPFTHVEQFAADNYCSAACFSLSCQVRQNGFNPFGDDVEDEAARRTLWGKWFVSPQSNGLQEKDTQPNDDYQDEHSVYDPNNPGASWGTCANPGTNYIGVDGDNFTVYEYNAQQNRNLNGMVTYTKDVDSSNTIGEGDLVAWVTWNSTHYWLHWAHAGAADKNRPLMHS